MTTDVKQEICNHCGIRIYRDITSGNIQWRHYGTSKRECFQQFAEPKKEQG